jgi:hypothetical protein
MFIDPQIYDDEARAITAALLGDGSAVNDDDLAVHEAVAIAAHERRVLSELRRSPETPFRNPEVVHLEQPLRQSVTEIGVEDAGSDGVDGDSEVRRFA